MSTGLVDLKFRSICFNDRGSPLYFAYIVATISFIVFVNKNCISSSPPISKLSTADGVATLCAFTAKAVGKCLHLLPEIPKVWLITGGGRHNLALLKELKKSLLTKVKLVEDVGLDGDALEAQAFGYLAQRSVLGLPLSLPSTTGVQRPLSGGLIFRAS